MLHLSARWPRGRDVGEGAPDWVYHGSKTPISKSCRNTTLQSSDTLVFAMAALDGLNNNEKAELACSLSALLCADAGVDINEENMNAVLVASGNKVANYWTPVFASTIEKAGGVDKFCKGPGSGKFDVNLF
jgi:hypothetical protein